LVVLLRLVVGLGLLVAILFRVDFSQADVHWGLGTILTLVAGVVVQLVAQALSAERWRLIMGASGRGVPRFGYLYRLYLIGNFFSIFLPTSIGGDAVRVVAVAPSAGGKVRGAMSILLDRLFGVAALGLYLLLGLLLGGAELTALGEAHLRWPVVAAGLAGLVVLGVAGLLIVRLRLHRSRIAWSGGWELAQSLLGQPGRLLGVSATSLLVQGTYIVAWLVLGVGLGLRIPLPVYLVCVPIVSLGAMMPITFSGLGIREGAWILLLASLGIPRSTVLVFSLMYFVAFVVVGAIGGLAFLFRGLRDASLIAETS
jgi:uncharacterized membrane protein YbhN (UPF0104 family)